MGLAQINQTHFAEYGLTLDTAFEPCRNLKAASGILEACYVRASKRGGTEQTALRDAFSCYYSGNFTTGYKTGYVINVVTGHSRNPKVVLVSNENVAPVPAPVGMDLTSTPHSALVF